MSVSERGDDLVARVLAGGRRIAMPWREYPGERVRPAIVAIWRVYAVIALLTVAYPLDRLIGPVSIPAYSASYSPGADFGGFYTGATIAWRGDFSHLGDLDTQKRTQREIQKREGSGWKWFNPLPHPPVLSLMTAPLAALRLRVAYWVWVTLSFVAAGVAAYILGRALTPSVPLATTLVFFSYEPLWHLLWWGQVDAFLLLLFASGACLLLRARSRRDEIAAGALMGILALIPQYAIVPFLALLWGRRRAALGMAASAGALALASVAMVGAKGVERYRDLAEYFGRFRGTDTVTEGAMFNIRGMVMRMGLDMSDDALLRLVWLVAIPLAALAVVAAGRSLPAGRSPDLALSVVILAALLASYHTHRQTLVFLFVLFAAFVGRALRPGTTPWLALTWLTPVIGLHLWTVYLRNEIPIRFYPIQKYQTPVALALLVALCAALLIPAVSRRLAGWPRSTEVAANVARKDEAVAVDPTAPRRGMTEALS
jgi:hypothetical protein